MPPQTSSILVRGVNWLGDAVMATPALRRLREAHPTARITLLTPAKLAGLWDHHPDLDQVVSIPEKASPWQVARLLRPLHCDWAIILPNSPRAALECFGIPRRTGYARPWRNWLLTEAIPVRADDVPMHKRSPAEIRRRLETVPLVPETPPPLRAHHIFHYLDLIAACGGSNQPCAPHLTVRPEEQERVASAFWPEGAPRGGWLGLNGGAEYGPAKRWPVERFVETARRLHQLHGCGCLVLGGPGDRDLAGSMASQLAQAQIQPVVNLAGRTSLRQLCAVLAQCRLILTNDSGPMHVAAALGVPLVALFGSTSPALTRPGHPSQPGPQAILHHPPPCAPCFLRECPVDSRCLRVLTVEMACQAAQDLLAQP